MELKKIYESIIEIMDENGIKIENNDPNSINLNEYINSSIQWISFILSLEEKFGIQWPDEFIFFNNNVSLNEIAKIIVQLSITK